MDDYDVRVIDNKDTYDYLLNIHYAKRIPSITYAYGLFHNNELVGVITYGTPPSHALKMGLAGKENYDKVLELNRLCLKHNKKNEASYLISKSLKLLPKGRLIISFADMEQNHTGVVYQACNFHYLGLSAKRTDMKLRDMNGKHPLTLQDEFRGIPDRASKLKEKYGDQIIYEQRSRKHRYLFITGSKNDKKILLKQVKYKVEPYPKK